VLLLFFTLCLVLSLCVLVRSVPGACALRRVLPHWAVSRGGFAPFLGWGDLGL
jgi:hypothetical protein